MINPKLTKFKDYLKQLHLFDLELAVRVRIDTAYSLCKTEYELIDRKESLAEYLGLTKSQYELYLENPFACLKLIRYLHLVHVADDVNKLIISDGMPFYENRTGDLVAVPIHWLGNFNYVDTNVKTYSRKNKQPKPPKKPKEPKRKKEPRRSKGSRRVIY